MKNGLTAALAVAAFAAASAAQAQDNESGIYAGAGVGSFDVQIDDFDDVDATLDRYDSDDTAWKAFVGWRVSPYLAFEAAYVNLGSPDDEIIPGTDLTLETDGFAPYIVGTIPIGDWFELFAKAGYYWYDTEARISTAVGSVSEDESDSTFTWSAGAGVNVFERVNIRLEYEQFDFDAADDSKALWLTGAWRF
jgi:Outer membrane protein beta-barrel domain